jgi:hypothetical protein
MTIKDACKILSISGDVNPAIIKKAYREASKKYHPDSGGSTEMMQAVNAAYDLIKDLTGNIHIEGSDKDYGKELNAAINLIKNLNLSIEICGSWVWVSGMTYPHKSDLKAAGYFFARKKAMWYFRPADYVKPKKSKPISIGKIRSKYGSELVEQGYTPKESFIAN